MNDLQSNSEEKHIYIYKNIYNNNKHIHMPIVSI